MPYIKSADYSRAARLPVTAGELNYAITLRAIDHIKLNSSLIDFRGQALTLCESYINRRGLTYTVGNEVLGVIACCGLELMRRCGETKAVRQLTEMLADVGGDIYVDILAPYEDGKIKENGDVYPVAVTG